jgi:hypothetical protein
VTIHIQPLSEVTERAKLVLVKELGVVDTLRFLNQFRSVSSNYTIEREHLFIGQSVKSIVAKIKIQRS